MINKNFKVKSWMTTTSYSITFTYRADALGHQEEISQMLRLEHRAI